MATWKKVIVSGSNISQLNNDANYLLSGDSSILLSGSFSGSFEGDGSGLTGVVASNANALTDGNGIADFSYDGSSAGVTVAVEADGSTLSVGTGGVKVADAGITATQIATSVAGDGLAGGGGTALSVNVDDSSIEINSDSLRVKGGGITNGMLANSGSTIGSTFVALGSTVSTFTGLTNVTAQSFIGDLTGTAQTASYVAAASIDGTVANATTAVSVTGGGSGSFSGSFEGDGSGLTGVSAQVEESLLLGNGLNGGTFTGQTAVTASVNADGSTLTVGASGVKVSDAGITETQLNTSVAGTGLSGGGGTALSVDYGTSAGTAAQGNTGVTFNGTANEIELSTNTFTTVGGGGTVTIGLPDNVTISGDLVVQGTASFQDTQNLAIADRFILLASGSSTTGDGGIVVQQTTQDVGEVFAYENSVTRWGIGVDFNASASAYTPDAFMAAALNGSENSHAAISASHDDRYNAVGNIFTSTTDESIWIYS